VANNPFQTPANPWTVVHSNGALFNTSARVTRLTSRWASPAVPFTALKTCWNSSSIAQAVTGFGYALKYLAAGSAGDATSSYTQSLGESAASAQFETDPARLYSQSVPFTYAWCKGGLSGSQQTDLLARIESNQVSLEANIGALGKFLIDGCGNGNVGMPGYVFNWCAADGQAGITDRSTNMRNLVQNMVVYINQQYNDGIWTSYDALYDYTMQVIVVYHIATGNESLLGTRCPSIIARGEALARMFDTSNNNYFLVTPHNANLDSTGKHIAYYPSSASATAVYSDVTRDLTMAWVRDQQLAHCTPTQWSHLQLQSEATWVGFLFHDTTLTGVSPLSAGTPSCKAFPGTGVAQFRGGWGANDVICGFTGGAPGGISDHTLPNAGNFHIRVGSTWLVSDGYAYGHRGAGATWELGSTTNPPTLASVGEFTMCRSGVSFSPSATEATRVDRDGSAAVNITPNSQTKYPAGWNLTNGVRQTWDSGVMGAMFDDGILAKVTAVITPAFPQMTAVQRTVGYRRGASSDKGTFIIYDQFTAPSTINQIRANFWCKSKPTVVSETVLQGSATAGVTQWGGDHVIFKNGSYQATIQMCTPFNTINGVGGVGYESFFDAPANATTGYATSGGANLDFLANSGTDTRLPTEYAWLQGQWRASFQTTRNAALGEMLFVITVDAVGTTAPTYTKSQALALLTPSSGAILSMPGFSTFAQKQGLDFMSGNNSAGLPTLYAALFTTLPLDDGTGGVEVSGTGYARVALSSSTFSLASGGAPATTTNASAITFPVAGASWGTVVGVGFFDAPTGGNYWGGDYLGTAAWMPFTCTSASPGVLTSPAHGLSNANLVEVTAKYGGTLPTTAGSWAGALTVANATTDTFTAGVNTTSTGDGMVRLVLTQAVASAATVTIPIGSITLSLG